MGTVGRASITLCCKRGHPSGRVLTEPAVIQWIDTDHKRWGDRWHTDQWRPCWIHYCPGPGQVWSLPHARLLFLLYPSPTPPLSLDTQPWRGTHLESRERHGSIPTTGTVTMDIYHCGHTSNRHCYVILAMIPGLKNTQDNQPWCKICHWLRPVNSTLLHLQGDHTLCLHSLHDRNLLPRLWLDIKLWW